MGRNIRETTNLLNTTIGEYFFLDLKYEKGAYAATQKKKSINECMSFHVLRLFSFVCEMKFPELHLVAEKP